jgi:hypothetical protein
MKSIIHLLRRNFLVLIAMFLLGVSALIPATSLAATSTNPRLAVCSVKNSNPIHPTKTEPIGYKTIRVSDSTLLAGQTKTGQVGHNGTRLITYTATYKKGKLTGCRHTGTKVTVAPQDTLIHVGTQAAPPTTPAPTPVPTAASTCTNGTYVNSAGNTVCSPESASSQPAGATAQCMDGSYSFSQSRSGTCSHHGGVASWL